MQAIDSYSSLHRKAIWSIAKKILSREKRAAVFRTYARISYDLAHYCNTPERIREWVGRNLANVNLAPEEASLIASSLDHPGKQAVCFKLLLLIALSGVGYEIEHGGPEQAAQYFEQERQSELQ